MSEELKKDIKENVMSLVQKGKIKMKPKWYFVLGSFILGAGVFALFVFSSFLVSLMVFSLRTHGPMGQWRYHQLLENFPWWSLPLAVLGIGLGVWILKKYDFSYRKNFLWIIIGFIAATILAGWFVNYSRLDSIWTERKPMRGFYHRYDGGYPLRGPGWRREAPNKSRGYFPGPGPGWNHSENR